MADDKNNLISLAKTILTIFVPLITAIVTANYQYTITRQENSDRYYRELVSKLADADPSLRHTAAASIGTYLADERYLDETIDILIVRLSTEPNFSVRNSIIGSLKKIERLDVSKDLFKEIIDRLLTISRNNLIQDYSMKHSLDKARDEYRKYLEDLREAEARYGATNRKSDELELGQLRSQITYKLEDLQQLQRLYDELQLSKPLIADMVSIVLSEKSGEPLSRLEFLRTNLNYSVLTDLNLQQATMDWANFLGSNFAESKVEKAVIFQTDFSWSLLTNTQFIESRINKSLFVNADLLGTRFMNGNFDEVYFLNADLKGAKFNGVEGLKPVYFYRAKNLDTVTFDDPEFVSKINALTIADFEEAVNNSGLSSIDKRYLLEESSYL